MNRLLRVAAPRFQAPLAAVMPLVLIALVVMHAVRISQFSAGGMRVAAVFVGASSFPVVRLLFLRKGRQVAYAGALLWPPLLAAVVGPLLVAHMRAAAPRASYAFAGVSLANLGPDWVLLVAILSAAFGLLGSAALTVLVCLVARAVEADESTGARRFTVTAWSIALACAIVVRFALGSRERVFVDGAVLVATIALLLQGAAIVRERSNARAPLGGPYR